MALQNIPCKVKPETRAKLEQLVGTKAKTLGAVVRALLEEATDGRRIHVDRVTEQGFTAVTQQLARVSDVLQELREARAPEQAEASDGGGGGGLATELHQLRRQLHDALSDILQSIAELPGSSVDPDEVTDWNPFGLSHDDLKD